ncbi:MAG: hypothetical protein D6748_10355 [Calditrichaeota bacterium]|nr:MAG: hypothetical protein D6748_10355 [Calditrichota bacterium]
MESEGRYVLNFEVVQLPMRVPEYPINVLQEVNYTFNKAFLEGHVYLLLLFRGNINSDLLFVTAGLKVDWNNVEIKGRTTRV